MYVEGGPEAQLYVNAGGRELEFVGSHGSSFAGIENTVRAADPERPRHPPRRAALAPPAQRDGVAIAEPRL